MANPCDGVRIPTRRTQDTDEQVIDRTVFRSALLPVVPDRYRALVAVGGGAGLRWGEAAGLCVDALDLDGARLRVIRTVIEVSGHTAFKPFPKTTAGRRAVPLPSWLVTLLREHLENYPPGAAGLVFANQVGGAYRRTLFRTRIWRPALVRCGLLGLVEADGDKFRGEWTDAAGVPGSGMLRTEPAAVKHVVRQQTGGLRSTTSATRTRRGLWTTACRSTWFNECSSTSGLRRRSTSTHVGPTIHRESSGARR